MVSSPIMSLKPVSTAPNSSLRSRFMRTLRSPLLSLSRACTIRCMGAVMARISSKPQIAAAIIARTREMIMLTLAVTTASTIESAASSAECRLRSITLFRCLRPVIQAGVSTSPINCRAWA
ncbi:hypothetical protein D3C72_2151020 [compost metagenome]